VEPEKQRSLGVHEEKAEAEWHAHMFHMQAVGYAPQAIDDEQSEHDVAEHAASDSEIARSSTRRRVRARMGVRGKAVGSPVNQQATSIVMGVTSIINRWADEQISSSRNATYDMENIHALHKFVLITR
jgi:hypothetical protein